MVELRNDFTFGPDTTVKELVNECRRGGPCQAALRWRRLEVANARYSGLRRGRLAAERWDAMFAIMNEMDIRIDPATRWYAYNSPAQLSKRFALTI